MSGWNSTRGFDMPARMQLTEVPVLQPPPTPVGYISSIAAREAATARYWSRTDPISDLRTWWRAQTFRHIFHVLPGETTLELGCGSGKLTKALFRVTRGECPITAVTFSASGVPEDLRSLSPMVRVLAVSDFPGELRGRTFDYVVASNLLDLKNTAWVLRHVQTLLRPGGRLLFFETNPWNPIFQFRRLIGKLVGWTQREGDRSLPNQIQLHELISELGFVRIALTCYDFLYPPI